MVTTKGESEVIRAGRVLSGMTLLSRCLGLCRDMLMAPLLGTGWLAGAFYLAWSLPNLFRRLLGEGALSSAFIPLFARTLEQEDASRARHFLSAALGTLGFLLLLLILIGLALLYLLPPALWVFLFEKPGTLSGLEYADHFKTLVALLFPYLLPICILALLTGALQCKGRFGRPALAPVILNVFWIAALLVGGVWWGLPPGKLTLFLAVVILLGGVMQVLVQLPVLRKCGLLVRPRLALGESKVRQVAKDMAPVAVGLAIFQINTLLDQLFAVKMVAQAGANTYLFYANRLFQFPLALVGTALAVASLPRMSTLAVRGETGELRSVYDLGCRVGFFFSIPAALGLALLAHPILHLLFVRGAFSLADAQETGRVLACFSFGLPFVCLSQLVTRLHQAMGDRRTPVRIGVRLVLLNLALNLLLVRPFGVSGLAGATSFTAMIGALWLHLRLGRLGLPGGSGDVGRSFVRTFLAALVMGGGVWLTQWGLGSLTLGRFLTLLVPMLAGLIIYLGWAWWRRSPELKALLGRGGKAC